MENTNEYKKINRKRLQIIRLLIQTEENNFTYILSTKRGNYKIVYTNNQLESVTRLKNPFLD